ncbi:MAG: DUF4302 domain-containing protein [Prevotella sp.]|nr:DUF4302 domain-containing protein [Prevotella sp.]
MKRYISNIGKMATSLLFAGVVASVTLTACTFEDEDYFDESASLRIEHTNQAIQNALVSAPNGWVMQYYTGTGVAHFEGFNLFAKFEDSEKVLLAGDHRFLRDGKSNVYTECSSLYEMLLEDGPVLAFNTWNDVLSPFVDPVSPWAAPGNIVKDGAGMQGDNNFVVMSYNDDEVILRGERYRAEVRLVKCDRTWDEYIADTKAMKDRITSSSINAYLVTNDVDSMYFVGLRKGVFRYCERVYDPLKIDSLACCFTPNGFRTEHENTLGENTFQEFTLSEDGTCLVNEDGTVKVTALWDDYVITNTTLWKFDTSVFSAEQASLYDQINQEIKKHNSNWSLESIGIGKSTGGNSVIGLVLTFYTNAAQTKTNTAGLALTRVKVGDKQMQIISEETDKVDKNMETICKKATNMENLVRSFAATLNGVYSITPDDYFLPTGGTFTAINGGTTFVLVK